MFAGFASMRSRNLAENPHLLTVWDGDEGGVGGTGHLINRWRARFGEPIWIDLKRIVHELQASSANAPDQTTVSPLASSAPDESPNAKTSSKPRREVKTMLFADVEGFSKLSDDKKSCLRGAFSGWYFKDYGSLGHTASLHKYLG